MNMKQYQTISFQNLLLYINSYNFTENKQIFIFLRQITVRYIILYYSTIKKVTSFTITVELII